MERKVTTETLVELAEVVLKNNNLQLRGTAIATKFAPLHGIIFMADLEERILEDIELQPRI